MKYHVTFSQFIIFFCFIISSEINALNHVFIDLKYKKATVTVGTFSEKKIKKSKLKTVEIDKLSQFDSLFYNENDDEVLIYIHSMLGNQKTYHKNSLRTLECIFGWQ